MIESNTMYPEATRRTCFNSLSTKETDRERQVSRRIWRQVVNAGLGRLCFSPNYFPRKSSARQALPFTALGCSCTEEQCVYVSSKGDHRLRFEIDRTAEMTARGIQANNSSRGACRMLAARLHLQKKRSVRYRYTTS